MPYHVYILYSPSHKRTYVGQTEQLKERVVCHNAGRVRSTKPYRPWVLLHRESYPTRADAMERERWYKSPRGRQALSTLLSGKLTSGLSVPSGERSGERDEISIPTGIGNLSLSARLRPVKKRRGFVLQASWNLADEAASQA